MILWEGRLNGLQAKGGRRSGPFGPLSWVEFDVRNLESLWSPFRGNETPLKPAADITYYTYFNFSSPSLHLAVTAHLAHLRVGAAVTREQDEHEDLIRAIGKAIARRRKALGLTQEQLSEAAGLAQASLSHIERGVTSPSIERLAQLAGILECRLSDFLSETGTGPADRATRIHQKLSGLSPMQQDALERLMDEAVALAMNTRPTVKRRLRKQNR
ncbi:helix-turn-helix domain-containing protein [Burkholderia cenocepacia]|uniref:helix-turn-helix domain-containing protein n=1 Tax=Burkholderia cenocepacia TaxID=95486 RepID=UPI0028588A40|nr:helix-turn-helix domain-containing protein [Burkholderia cenocepacia]MDR5646434.1 helix-turn-helix domain-containing protein [Burkholderia cenocepacia]